VENEAFDDERDRTARDRVAEVLEVDSVTELRAHAEYVLLVGQDGGSEYDHVCCLMCCHFQRGREVSPGEMCLTFDCRRAGIHDSPGPDRPKNRSMGEASRVADASPSPSYCNALQIGAIFCPTRANGFLSGGYSGREPSPECDVVRIPAAIHPLR
jgi:hypothetical protein